MKSAVLFLVVFVIGVIFSDVVKDWWSWFFGLVFGISIAQICEYAKEQEKLKRRQLR